MKKLEDLQSLTAEELELRLIEARKALMKHNAQIATGTALKNPGEVRETKRVVARIKTLLKKKTEGSQNK